MVYERRNSLFALHFCKKANLKIIMIKENSGKFWNRPLVSLEPAIYLPDFSS